MNLFMMFIIEIWELLKVLLGEEEGWMLGILMGWVGLVNCSFLCFFDFLVYWTNFSPDFFRAGPDDEDDLLITSELSSEEEEEDEVDQDSNGVFSILSFFLSSSMTNMVGDYVEENDYRNDYPSSESGNDEDRFDDHDSD